MRDSSLSGFIHLSGTWDNIKHAEYGNTKSADSTSPVHTHYVSDRGSTKADGSDPGTDLSIKSAIYIGREV